MSYLSLVVIISCSSKLLSRLIKSSEPVLMLSVATVSLKLGWQDHELWPHMQFLLMFTCYRKCNKHYYNMEGFLSCPEAIQVYSGNQNQYLSFRSNTVDLHLSEPWLYKPLDYPHTKSDYSIRVFCDSITVNVE